MLFTAPEQFLDEFTKSPLDITTLAGDWPFPGPITMTRQPGSTSPGRTAHNQLLTAERIYAGLGPDQGFQNYPSPELRKPGKQMCGPITAGAEIKAYSLTLSMRVYARAKTV